MAKILLIAPLRSLLAVLVAGLVLSACSSVPRHRSGTELHQQPPISAVSAAAQQRFDRAVHDLEAGRYAEAEEAFRLVQAEFPDDPIAVVAELYIARSMMGDVAAALAGVADGSRSASGRQALGLLAALMGENDGLDGRVRYAAQCYYALELALQGSPDEALQAFRNYPGPSLSPAVLERDRAAIWPLLGESFYRAGRGEDALVTYARLDVALRSVPGGNAELGPELGEASGGVEAGDATAATDADMEDVLTYARARAFEIARRDLSEALLQELLVDELPLLRAAAGWGLLGRALDAGVDERQRPALEDVFNRVAVDFVTVGAAERAAELSMQLAAIGGPRRLTIGALVPLSGPNRTVGYRALAGMLLAQNAFHHAGEPAVTLVIQDANADIDEAFAALRAHGVQAVVGPLDTARARRVAELATHHGIPTLTLAADPAQGVGQGAAEQGAAEQGAAEQGAAGQGEAVAGQQPETYAFRNFIHAAAEARAAARISFEQLGDRRAAIVYPDIGYGRMMAEAFADEFRARGGQIAVQVAYDRGHTDYAGTARRVASASPDAVFIPDTAGKVAEVTAFLANENVWGLDPAKRPPARAQRTYVHYLGTSLWADPALVRQAGSYVTGALVPAWFSAAFSAPESQEFANRFQAIYGRMPDSFEVFAYDSVLRLRALMLDNGINRPQGLRDALVAHAPFRGATGAFRFDATGEAVRTLRFIQVQGNAFTEYPVSVQIGSGASGP